MQTVRFADAATASRYPLAIAGPADWRHVRGKQDDHLTAEIALPELADRDILVPSLALGGAATPAHQWTLVDADATWALPIVPSAAGASAPVAADPRVSVHIDCFHVQGLLKAPMLRVRVDARQVPDAYLLCVSARPLALTTLAVPTQPTALPLAPPQHSQMTAAATLAPRICSPTSVGMVLAHWGCPEPREVIVAECHDRATGMYGVWPLAINAAARRRSLGAVEVFADWGAPARVLQAGIPLITSIRFETGQLPGSPLSRTGGHLVVVHAAGPDTIGVNDPAAACDAEVGRQYDARAFTDAWLRHRGAAYILPP
jgi:hypothetical protein